ncbi:MAG: tetratricopeptide repeat protein [candidate division WOR-3 bacterium]|nr:tetratricopeptide repeat protein [candidate division WOR-3 bacterium]
MEGKSLPDRLRTPAGLAFVLAAVALFSVGLYLPTAQYSFVWDDETLIVGNSLLAHSRPADIFGRGFWAGSPEPVTGPGAAYYRPLVTLSFWLDLKLSHTNPHWFHIVNLLLYALAAVAVTLVLWELLHSGVWALLGGLLFAAHSSHVESAAFISGRTDIMLTLFTAIAAFALLRSFRKHNRLWWLVVPPAFGLALLSKETAVLFPLLVVLAPLLVGVRYDRYYWVPVLATVLVLAGYLFLRAGAVPVPIPFEGRVSLGARLVAIANTFGLYIRMFFWPFEHHAKYPASDAFFVPTPNLIAALLFIVTVPLLALRRRFVATLWGYAWTIGFLLPVVSIASIGPLAAERLLYLPSAGLVMVVVTILSRLLTFRVRTRQVVGAGLTVVIVLLGADSVMRTRIWKNAETLFTAMIREAPTAPSAYANLADAIAGSRPDSALALYDHALRLDQGYIHAHLHAAIRLSQKGDHRRAIHYLRVANELQPNSVLVLNNLGLAFLAAGETDSALATFAHALTVQPGSALLHLNRANVLVTAGQPDEAEAELHRALALDSTLPAARTMLVDRLKQRGRYDSAIVLMQGVVRDQPSAAYFNRLGSLFISAGDSARAGDSYERALRLDSAFVPALYNQSVLLAARGESAAARVLAGNAYRLRPDLQAIRELYLQFNPVPGDSPRPGTVPNQ